MVINTRNHETLEVLFPAVTSCSVNKCLHVSYTTVIVLETQQPLKSLSLPRSPPPPPPHDSLPLPFYKHVHTSTHLPQLSSKTNAQPRYPILIFTHPGPLCLLLKRNFPKILFHTLLHLQHMQSVARHAPPHILL